MYSKENNLAKRVKNTQAFVEKNQTNEPSANNANCISRITSGTIEEEDVRENRSDLWTFSIEASKFFHQTKVSIEIATASKHLRNDLWVEDFAKVDENAELIWKKLKLIDIFPNSINVIIQCIDRKLIYASKIRTKI